MRTKYNTPEEAELAFYDALERADISTMKQVWSDDDSIVCIHPGSGRLEGRADVVESFYQLFQNAPAMDFSITDARCSIVNDMAIHMVREAIEIDGELISVLVSTNIYQRINGGWKMTLHHASPEPDEELDLDYDELDYTLETEVPIVLH
ncbi:MAG: nuclear transport factor 2 family protein [Gammaproteobacteria bacterium]|nr:nuclear transport factor 2 family protein [Gammaproteobacteria bacterium]